MFGLNKKHYEQYFNEEVFDETEKLKDNYLFGLKKDSKIK